MVRQLVSMRTGISYLDVNQSVLLHCVKPELLDRESVLLLCCVKPQLGRVRCSKL